MLRQLLSKAQNDGSLTSELLPLHGKEDPSSPGHGDKATTSTPTTTTSTVSTAHNPSTPNSTSQLPSGPANGGPVVNLDDLGILRNVVNKWKSFSTKRKEHGDKNSLYRKGPAPIDEPGRKKRRTVIRCTHGTLDSDVESLGEDDDYQSLNEDKKNSIASSRGLILYFAKLATTRDEDESIDLQFVYSLLQGGADINFTDKHGQTILHEIARAWHIDVAKFVLSHGADINKGDRFGRTPLHLAVSVGYVEMIEFLIENGGNINSRTKGEMQTPIHYSAKNNQFISLRILLKHGANINDRDYKQRTPLFVAAEAGRSEAARFLLEAGAPAAVYDDKGNSCLSLMVEKMPGIAMEALEQFHSMDRALRKKYYYLNYLEKMSATDEGDDNEKEAGSAKTALQVIVQYSELELIMHPALRRLLSVKWELFGKWSSIWQVVINLVYTLLWTVLGLLLPRDGNYYRPLSKFWWRVALECIGCTMTIYFILTQVLDARNVEKREHIYKAWRARQVERDIEHCHPRWPEERRYLQGELERIQRNTRGNYFRNAWNVIDWATHGAVLMVVLTRAIAVLLKSKTASDIHPRVFAISLILIWLRLMKACRSFKALGPFITLLGHVVSDTLKFAFLYFEFFIPYACAFWILFGGDKNAEIMEKHGMDASGWRNFNDLVYSVYEITLVGNYPWEALLVVDRKMAQVLVGTYLAMSAVVCLNLYIALMSDTFARVYENAKANAVMQQAMQVLNIERTLGKKKLHKIKKFIATDCAPQEVYCANEEGENGPSNTNDQIKHHMDTSLEIVKEMIKELHNEVKEIKKQTKNGPRGFNQNRMQYDMKDLQSKQDKKFEEINLTLSTIMKSQEKCMTLMSQRSKSGASSKGDEMDSDYLTTDSQKIKRRTKKKRGTRTSSDMEELVATTPTGTLPRRRSKDKRGSMISLKEKEKD